jgi:hypothetical protein
MRLAGAPQMVEISRDGRRVYFTNSLYASWDDIFYPDGVGAWMARVDANTETGGMAVDPRFFPQGDDFRGLRVHQRVSRAGMHRATPTASSSSPSVPSTWVGPALGRSSALCPNPR